MSKTLDLHGLKHEHVYNIVDKFVGNHIILGTKEVYIITGHSIKMKEIVAYVVQDYDIQGKEEWGNTGKIILDLK
jgi:hypothetical protein